MMRSTKMLDTSSMQQSPVSKFSLLDLPVELLDQIVLHCVNNEPITVRLASNSSSLTRNLLPFVSRRKRYTVGNFPHSLLLTNRIISRLAFNRVWKRKPLIISLAPSDALCFLLHGLSRQQRDALCRIQLPRFLLSWQFPVNSDIWLIAGKEKNGSWYAGAKDPVAEERGKRFLALTGMLGKRASCGCQSWKLNLGLIQS
jgi:hypothetical protein